MGKSVIDEKNAPLFDEEEAYQELLMILQEAIAMQSFDSIEPLIEAWKRKYPLEQFSDIYKRKIKALKEYFEQEYRIFLSNLTEKKKVDTVKAYFELCKIVGNAKWDRNLTLAKAKIETWKNRYYTSDKQNSFSTSYQAKIRHLTDEDYLFSITERNYQKAAVEELEKLVDTAKTKRNFEEFKKSYEDWCKKYPYEDLKSDSKSKVDNLMKYEYEPAFEEYQIKLKEANSLGIDMSKEDPTNIEQVISTNIIQKSAYFELLKILNNPNDSVRVLDWIYKYRMIEFDDYHKGLIVEKTAPYYKIPKGKDIQISDIGTTDDLSYNEFEDMDKSRKLAITQYFAILYSGRNLEGDDRQRFENVYQKSQKAILIQETFEEANEFEKKHEPEISKNEFNPINDMVEDLFEKSKEDDFNGD